jgi:hypothetical protein
MDVKNQMAGSESRCAYCYVCARICRMMEITADVCDRRLSQSCLVVYKVISRAAKSIVNGDSSQCYDPRKEANISPDAGE